MLTCELLSKKHNRKAFDCGQDDLNVFLKQYANQQGKRNLSRTYVLIDTDNPSDILGFYSLSSIHINQQNFNIVVANLPKNMDIPAILLGRLAVDKNHTGKGLSSHLLAHAFQTTLSVSQLIGVALLIVEAKTEQLVTYYEKIGFTKIDDSLKLVLPISKIQ